jgi:hypothetical protein
MLSTGKRSLNRRILLSFLVVLASAVLLATTCLGIGPSGASATPDHIVLTWMEDARTTQTISWRTDDSVSMGKVRFAEVNPASPQDIASNAKILAVAGELLPTNRGDFMSYSTTLTGLKPGTRYNYQVGTEKEWSRVLSFTTVREKMDSFKFLVFGDSQSINYNTWRQTLLAARQAQPDALFFMNAGDLVDVGQEYGQWHAWLTASEDVIDAIPVMPATGNHEAYTPYRSFSKPTYFTAQFKVPDNGPDGLKGQVYSFDVGNVHFVVLDTQAGEQARIMPDLLERQRDWLEEDLRKSDKKWKIAIMHRPAFNNKVHVDNPNIQNIFVPIFEKYRVNIAFSGHDHVVARARPNGGTVYAATGRSGSKTYSDVVEKEYNTFFFNPVDEPNYMVVQVSPDKLAVSAVGRSGIMIDSWEVTAK